MCGVGKVRGGALHSVWLALKCARNNCCLSWAVGTRGCRGEAFALPPDFNRIRNKKCSTKKPCIIDGPPDLQTIRRSC